MSKNTGGPAFPTENEHQSGPSTMHYEGMTLRDWFAGQALAGILTDTSYDHGKPEIIAKRSYQMADAMLAERSKE